MPSVGKDIPHDSAIGHVSGTSEYVCDIPKMRNELIVDFFHSTVGHGQILSIDLEEARKIQGVVALYTYKDIPGVIGALGTTLGNDGVNISRMTVGREGEHGRNIILLNTDTLIEKNLMKKVITKL